MKSKNYIELIGYIGSVDTKTFDNGKIVNAKLATTERYNDREGNQQENTTWHRLTFIGKFADLADKYVQKGDPLQVEGRIRNRKYTTQDGNEVSVTEIIVTDMRLLTSRSDKGDKSAEPKFKPIEKPAPSVDDDGDLPF